MEKPKSLADFLGVVNPKTGEQPSSTAAPKVSAKAFCRELLESAEFRSYILGGLLTGELPAPVVIRIMDVAWGKPVERLEVTEKEKPLESLSVEQLEKRALFLADVARRLRVADKMNQPDDQARLM